MTTPEERPRIIHMKTGPVTNGLVFLTYDLSPWAMTFAYVDLLMTSDWHIGNPAARLDRIQRLIEYLKRHPNVFLLVLGDLGEACFKDSKGSDRPQSVDPFAQYTRALDYLYPVRNQVLVLVWGNHDKRWLLVGAGDPLTYTTEKLGTPPPMRQVYLSVKFGEFGLSKPLFSTLCHHGDRMGSPKKENDALNTGDVNVLFLGDKHVEKREYADRYVSSTGDTMKRVILRSSSFLEGDGFGSDLCKGPTHFAQPFVRLFREGKWKPCEWPDDTEDFE